MKTIKARNRLLGFFSRIFSSYRPLPKTTKVIRPNVVEYDIEILMTISNKDIDSSQLRRILFDAQKVFFPNIKDYGFIREYKPRSKPTELRLEGKTQEFYRVHDLVLLADGVTFEVTRFGKKLTT